MSGRQMNLSMVISADAKGVAPATAETRREVESVGESGRAAARDLSLMAAANDEAAAASRRAMEALRGQSAAERDLRSIVNAAAGVRAPLDDRGYEKRRADIASYGAELDRLRAKFVPAAAAEQSLLMMQREINDAFRVGAITAAEQADALERVRLLHDRTAAAAAAQTDEYRRLAAAGREAQAQDQAQRGFNSLLGIRDPQAGSAAASFGVFENAGMLQVIDQQAQGAAKSTALASHEMTNLTYQMNDIAMMLSLGQSPFTMIMQQGPQVAQIMGQRGLGEIIPALGGAISNLISPTTLFLGGITAAGYAGYAAFRMIQPEVVNADEALERHGLLLEDIRKRYTLVEDAAKRSLGVSSSSDRFEIASSIRELDFLVREQGSDFRAPAGISNAWERLRGRAGQFDSRWALGESNGAFAEMFPLDVAEGQFKPFEDAIISFLRTAKEGLPDFVAFREAVLERWSLEPNNDALSKTVRVIMDATDKAVELTRAWKEMEDVRLRMEAGQRGPLIGSPEEQARNDYLDNQRLALRDAQRTFDAEIGALGARSPAELAAAARRREEARDNDSESDVVRRNRIELAERRALIEAEYELAEAARERGRALRETLGDAQLDLELSGRNAREIEQLRLEHQLLAQLRREAAANGVAINEQEVAGIRAVAAEVAKLRAIAGARDFIKSQTEELERLRVETALVGASDRMREQVLSRMDAEREIRERGIDVMGREANAIRSNNAALAEQTLELDRLRDAWGEIRSAGESAIDNVLGKLSEGDLKGALKSLGDEVTGLLMQLGVANPLKNAALGTNYGTLGDLGPGGILGRLFGGGDRMANSALSGIFGGQSVASMSVNAGTVVVSGALGLSGGAGGGIMSNVARMFGGANDNASGGDVQSTVWNFFAGKGLKGHQIAGIMGNVGGESSFNPLAVGDGGTSFGLFQHHAGRADGLLGSLGGRDNLSNVQGQLEFAWKELQTSESRALQNLMSAGNVREATAAFGGFERPQGFSWADPEAMHNWSGRLQEAERAMERFGGVASTATGDLQNFGGGLSQMGQNLSGMFPPAPTGGGGGALGAIGSLLGLGGGGNPSLSPMAWNVVSSGRMTGLYDVGGPTGGSDPTRIAGFVHEKEYVFDAVSTDRIGVQNLEAIRRGALKGYRVGGYAAEGGSGAMGGAVSTLDTSSVQRGNEGRAVVEVRLGADLEARILQRSGEQAVEIVQENDRARESLWQAGGHPK